MTSFRPWPLAIAWPATVVCGVLLLLGLVNAVVSTGSVGSWVPLVVLMPLPLVHGVRSIRTSRRRDGGA